jgi:hypothetical protein
VVKTVPSERRIVRAATPVSPLVRAAKPALALLVLASLIAAIAGGLLRAGVAWPALRENGLVAQAAAIHAALMLSGFLGTAIAIERAVAIKHAWAFAAPLASGSAGLLLLSGSTNTGAWLGVVAAALFGAVNVVVVARQRAIHTALLLVGALAWLVGNLLFASGHAMGALLPCWFAFPVLTIAAERLEMTRLMRRDPRALPALLAILAALLAGAALSTFAPAAGGVVYGVALTALALWFALFDIARRTALAHGLSRYMAICLLAGYAWLALAGFAWVGMALGCPGRDATLHALGLGFIVSMVMGHAPVILPAVARVKLLFGAWFYAPLVLLHGSLLLRLFGALARPEWRSTGAVLNAAAIALFAATLAGSAIAWRLRGTRSPHPPA